MANNKKPEFLQELQNRFGKIKKFGDSQSLFRIRGSNIRVYIRYSKIHARRTSLVWTKRKRPSKIGGPTCFFYVFCGISK